MSSNVKLEEKQKKPPKNKTWNVSVSFYLLWKHAMVVFDDVILRLFWFLLLLSLPPTPDLWHLCDRKVTPWCNLPLICLFMSTLSFITYCVLWRTKCPDMSHSRVILKYRMNTLFTQMYSLNLYTFCHLTTTNLKDQHSGKKRIHVFLFCFVFCFLFFTCEHLYRMT